MAHRKIDYVDHVDMSEAYAAQRGFFDILAPHIRYLPEMHEMRVRAMAGNYYGTADGSSGLTEEEYNKRAKRDFLAGLVKADKQFPDVTAMEVHDYIKHGNLPRLPSVEVWKPSKEEQVQIDKLSHEIAQSLNDSKAHLKPFYAAWRNSDKEILNEGFFDTEEAIKAFNNEAIKKKAPWTKSAIKNVPTVNKKGLRKYDLNQGGDIMVRKRDVIASSEFAPDKIRKLLRPWTSIENALRTKDYRGLSEHKFVTPNTRKKIEALNDIIKKSTPSKSGRPPGTPQGGQGKPPGGGSPYKPPPGKPGSG